jgi:PRC-barrel domain
MAAFDPATLDRWRALAIVDRDGTTVGTISEFYLDRETGYPTWALVNTGLFGATQTFVPLVHATEISDGLQVPYEKSHIKDTPRVDLHDELSPEEEATLFAHYGVEYEPSPEDQDAVGTEESDTVVAEESGPAAPGSTAAEEPGPVAPEPGTTEGPTVVPAEPTAEGPGSATTDPESAEGPGPIPADKVPEGPAPVATEPTGDEAPGPVRAEPGTVEGPDAVPAEPGTDEPTGARDGSGLAATDGGVPDEPGTADPDDATRVGQQGLRAEVVEPDGTGSAAEQHEASTEGDPDLSRTAPVEPGLPGSTAADPYGPVPTTIDKDADPAEQPPDESARSPEEADWPSAPAAAGSFEEQVPLDRPAGSSDRWHEAKLAAERERSARTPAAQPEERSPLERARRRLERLVGVGQEHSDPGDVSPTDRDAAERARRARLGFDDEDDDRRR